MSELVARLRPHTSVFYWISRIFLRDDGIVDPGEIHDRATLRAIRNLPPHILKDIGAQNL